MHFLNNLFLITGGVLFALSNQVIASPVLVAEGVAYEHETEKVLYTEKHFIESKEKHLVTYYEPSGEEFARKTLDYTSGDSAPFFHQYNSRLGEVIQVFPGEEDTIKVSYQSSSKAKKAEDEIDTSARLVIDAGFDNFIRQNWTPLQQGEKQNFNYLLPTRGATIELELKKVDCDPTLLCLKISPANPFLGFFAGDIKLEYHTDTRKLLRFVGRSNIADENGKYRNVSISYQHFSPTIDPIEQRPSS